MVLLKVQMGGEIRLIGPAPNSLSDIKKRTLDFFGIEKFYFTYTDNEGDEVIIEDQKDYELSLRFFKAPFKLKIIEPGVSCGKNRILSNKELENEDIFSKSCIIQRENYFNYSEQETRFSRLKEIAIQTDFTENDCLKTRFLCKDKAVQTFRDETTLG